MSASFCCGPQIAVTTSVTLEEVPERSLKHVPGWKNVLELGGRSSLGQLVGDPRTRESQPLLASVKSRSASCNDSHWSFLHERRGFEYCTSEYCTSEFGSRYRRLDRIVDEKCRGNADTNSAPTALGLAELHLAPSSGRNLANNSKT